jgi:hypothetical protein
MKSITRPPEHALEIFQYSGDRTLVWQRLTNQLVRQYINNFPRTLEPRE